MLYPILIAIVIAAIVYLVYAGKKKNPTPVKTNDVSKEINNNIVDSVETKLETKSETAPAVCGCGRSPTGLCVGLHALSDEEWQAQQPKSSAEDTVTLVAEPTVKTKKTTKPKKETVASTEPTVKKPRVSRKTKV